MTQISVQAEDFDLGAEYRRLCADAPGAGAVVTFSGLVPAAPTKSGNCASNTTRA